MFWNKKTEDGKSMFEGLSGTVDKVSGLVDKVGGFKLPTITTKNQVDLSMGTMGMIGVVLVALYLIFKRK